MNEKIILPDKEKRGTFNLIRFFKEMRNDTGYYYINEKLDLNDLLILIIFMIMSFALVVVKFLLEKTPQIIIIYAIVCIAICSPFLAHFIIKAFKILSFKRKKKKILTYGDMHIGKLIDSKQGPCIIKDDGITGIEKFSYYPVVEYYDDNGFVQLTSPFAVNNTHTQGLSSQQVTIYVYHKAFILSDFSLADSKEDSLEHRKNKHKDLSTKLTAEQIYAISLLCLIAVLNLIRQILGMIFS